jgi:hypothetical protein
LQPFFTKCFPANIPWILTDLAGVCRFVSVKYKSLDELPEGAVIGSAALRRQAQLLNKYPSLKIVNFRGNVQSRIRKLNEGQVLSPFPWQPQPLPEHCLAHA